jgi:antitoxin HicB
MKPKQRTTLNELLVEDDIYDEANDIVTKERLAWQLSEAMKKKRLTKQRKAEAMQKTSRAQLDRILDPKSGNVTLSTLKKAAKAVGKKLEVRLV